MCDNYGPCDRYEKLEAEISECGHDIALLRADNARLRAERDAARAAAVRWRNRARFWRRVADQTSIWAGPRFYKRVLQLSRRWRREGERHD